MKVGVDIVCMGLRRIKLWVGSCGLRVDSHGLLVVGRLKLNFAFVV